MTSDPVARQAFDDEFARLLDSLGLALGETVDGVTVEPDDSWHVPVWSFSSPRSVDVKIWEHPDIQIWVDGFSEFFVIPDDAEGIRHPEHGLYALGRLALTSDVRIERRWGGRKLVAHLRVPGGDWAYPTTVLDRRGRDVSVGTFSPVVRPDEPTTGASP